ncbi:phage major capsid protein [Deinococcus gobiensis]|uniref:Putative phage phi-C31 gp36 major capsid-like protein n=1 Tax=Deinococcus gobiensis (strain DSM 21396 / JCM 16679 / CGMCC 1.7299 / I-0) TaxID=745776 RepID=H8GX91_DEIGI|nr:phage major capsid protein [Deinococcus gobiensis]AFD25820.1 putative phage phi-C31 gp36 major capsid-like protein [Deinococcus gobiensis I-0]
MTHRSYLIASLAQTMSEAFSAPARSGSPLLGGALGHMPLFDGGDAGAQIQAELKKIEDGIWKKTEKRLEEVKAGIKVKDYDAELAALEKEHTEVKTQLTEVQTQLGRLDVTGGGKGSERKSAGQLLVESKGFDTAKQGERFVVGTEVKALSSAAGSAGVMVTQPQRLGIYEQPEEPHIRDLFSQGQTSNSSLVFPVRKTLTNAAAMVAELAQKPESDMTFEDKTFPVRKIAHFVKLSDEILADAPAIQSYVDTQLIEGLKDVEDVQLLKGNGVGQNLTGVYTVAPAYNRTTAGDSLIDVYRRAMTQLRLAKHTPTGLVLNPEDWEKVQLVKGTEGHYIWVNVGTATEPRLWGLPVRDTLALAAGEWLMGNFRRGAQIFDRMDARVEMTNTDQDDFVKNRVTMRAEERLALVIYDASAFVKNAPSA